MTPRKGIYIPDEDTVPGKRLERARIEAETLAYRKEADKFAAEISAFKEEERFNRLQADQIQRDFREEDASLMHQRIIDFTNEVNYSTSEQCINILSKLRSLNQEPITIRLLTPGGDVIAGLALFDYIKLLREEGIEIIIMVVGMAASMGTILLQAATERVVSQSSWLMVHEISAGVGGKLSEIIDEAKWNQRVQDRLLGILAERSTLSKRVIANRWKRRDWWFDADEAVEFGFADRVAN